MGTWNTHVTVSAELFDKVAAKMLLAVSGWCTIGAFTLVVFWGLVFTVRSYRVELLKQANAPTDDLKFKLTQFARTRRAHLCIWTGVFWGSLTFVIIGHTEGYMTGQFWLYSLSVSQFLISFGQALVVKRQSVYEGKPTILWLYLVWSFLWCFYVLGWSVPIMPVKT